MDMKTIWIFIDDSGVLHSNAQNNIFVYAGYSFITLERKEDAKRRYRALSHRVQDVAGIVGEVKASRLNNKNKAKLFRVMRNERSLASTVDIARVYNNILGNKNSIHRYKDYVLKRLVKLAVQKYINEGKLDSNEDLKIVLSLDEQATATDGIYNLHDSIYEELAEGVSNFDYGTFHEPVMHKKVEVQVKFCDSSCDYLIQSADILANRVWHSYFDNMPDLRNFDNHIWLHLP